MNKFNKTRRTKRGKRIRTKKGIKKNKYGGGWKSFSSWIKPKKNKPDECSDQSDIKKCIMNDGNTYFFMENGEKINIHISQEDRESGYYTIPYTNKIQHIDLVSGMLMEKKDGIWITLTNKSTNNNQNTNNSKKIQPGSKGKKISLQTRINRIMNNELNKELNNESQYLGGKRTKRTRKH
jgi:hypothetical protein